MPGRSPTSQKGFEMNQKLHVRYWLPMDAAALAGSSEYGSGTLPVSDDQLAELGKEDISLLIEHCGTSGNSLELESRPTWNGVKLALVRLRAKREQEKQAKQKAAEEREARILSAVSAIMNSSLFDLYLGEEIGAKRTNALRHDESEEMGKRFPLVEERLEQGLVLLREHENREAAEKEAKESALREAKEVERGQWLMRIAQFVSNNYDEYARAAREGYDVVPLLAKGLFESIRVGLDNSPGPGGDCFHLRRAPEHEAASCPARDNFVVRDKVVRIVQQSEIPGCSIFVSEIRTMTFWDIDSEEQGKGTGFFVELKFPACSDLDSEYLAVVVAQDE